MAIINCQRYLIVMYNWAISGTWSPEAKQRTSHYASALDSKVVLKFELHRVRRESLELYVNFHYVDSPSLPPILGTFSFAFMTDSSQAAESRTY